MKLGTRLLLVLLPTTAVVMMGYGVWSLAEGEDSVLAHTKSEMEAYATALSLELDNLQPGTAKGLINQVTQNTKLYAILIYDAGGRVLLVSDPVTTPAPAPPQFLRRVFERRETVGFRRDLEAEDVYSVVRPITDSGGRVTGALEVAQPLSFLTAEQDRIRQRFLMNLVTLAVATTLATLWVIRGMVTRPLARLAEAVRALGRGELARRVDARRTGTELSDVAREFNAMAEQLEGARAELVREAEERVALERRLRQAEKLATIGNVAAGLAHEIAAPLNVISGRAEMLLKRDSGPSERALRIIVRQIDRISTIVRRVLDVSRRREPHFLPVDLAMVLDGVVEFLEGELHRAKVVVVRQEPRPLGVVGDADQLHQVFANLVLNAIHALETVQEPRRIEVRLAPNSTHDGTVAIEIADTGPGIPADMVPHLFEPFLTTKASGTGLGLVVAQGIVGEHGGSLDAFNSADGGAVLRVRLRRTAMRSGGPVA